MAQRGIIQSRLRLDTKEFYTRLDAALKKAQQTANAMQKVFSKPLTLPTVPTASGGGRGGRTDPALAAQREAARQGLAAFRDLELAQRKNLITQAEFVRLSRDIERVLENERAQLERNTRGYAAYTDALRQINNGLNRGFNTQPAVRSVNDLSLALDRLQSAGDLLLAGGGLFALFRFINNSAKQSFNAATSLRLYREELERRGKSADEGVGILDRLGARFKINGEQIAGAALALTRYGLNASDIEEQLALVGASSVARTGNAAAGMNALADAYESGSSTALNFVGVAANLVTEFERYAATQGKVRDQLTRVQEGEAFTLALRREAGGQLASLNTLLEGYGGATSQAASESYSFGNAVGSAVTPALTTFFKTVSSVLAVFNGLPKVLQSAIVVTGVLTTTLGLLAFAYKNIVDVLNPFQTASTVLTVLLKNEIVARTRLGAVLALLGTRYGLVTAAVAANTEVAVASAGSLTLLQAVMIGLTRALALVRVAFARLIANPVVAALAAVGVAFLLVKNNIDIFRPALEALKASFQPVLDVVGRVMKAFGGMFAEGTVLGNFLRNGLINVASLLALTLVGLSNAVGQVIIAFQFWGDLFSQGYDQALANFDRRSAELTERTKAATNAILDATEAGYGQVAAQNAVADSADNAAAATARLTEEQKKQRADFQGRAAEFELSFDQTGLEADIASAQSSIQSFIDEVGAAADNLPLGSKLRREYREIELDLLKLRERISGRVIADTLAQAQEDTANAVVASMEAGAAKIIAQRDLDLEAERKAFVERTNALVEGSDTYNEFLDLYNAKTAAINFQANQALQQDAEERLETQRSLNEQISRMREQLSSEQAELSNSPLDAIRRSFEQTSDQIAQETTSLIDEVKQAYRDGAIDKKTYYAELDEIGRIGNARLLTAEEKATQDTRKILQDRRRQALEILDDQSNALARAQVEGMEEGFQKQIEQFKLERQARLQAYKDQLADFKGTLSERTRLVRQQVATELQLAQNNLSSAQAATKQALANLTQARKDYADQVKQKNEEALRQTLNNIKTISDARIAAAQQEVDGASGLNEQTVAYEKLLQVQRNAVGVAERFTRFERERSATAEEITNALSNEAQAQRGVVDVIQSQIDKLKELQQAQLDTLDSGSSVIDLYRESQQALGRDALTFNSQAKIKEALQAQLDAQAELYQRQILTNASVDEQLATLKAINETRAQAEQEGVNVRLSQDAQRAIQENAGQKLTEAPQQIEEATDRLLELDNRIRSLGQTLEGATSKLAEMLERAGSAEGLELKVTPVYDDSALRAASAAFAAAYEAEQAAAEELRRVQEEEQKRLNEAIKKGNGEIIEVAENAGAQAGAGLMGAFSESITANRGRIVDALRNALQPVRDLLPSSDAKRGPLSDLTYSGRKFITTWAGGMTREFPTLHSTALRAASIAKPAIAAIPTSRPAHFPAVGGAGAGAGDSVTVNFNGVPLTPATPFEMSASQFGRQAAQQARLEMRKRR